MRVGGASIFHARSDMAVVAQAGTEEEAFTLFSRHTPDVSLRDLRLPGMCLNVSDRTQAVVAAFRRGLLHV